MKSRTFTSPAGDKSGRRGRDDARSAEGTRPRDGTLSASPVDARPAADAMRQLQAVAQARFASTRQPTLQALMRTHAGDGASRVVQRCQICHNDECENGERCGRKDANAVFATPQGPQGERLQREGFSAADEAAIRAAFALNRAPRTEPVPSSPPESPRLNPQPNRRSDEDD